MGNMTPTRDIVFKRLFGKLGNEIILKDLLESILEIKIETIELDLDKEMEPLYVEEKKNILDVRAKIDNKTNINIEMQIKDNKHIEKRSLYHWSKLYLHELKRGKKYDNLPKTIVIVITNYTIFEDLEQYHTKWRLREEKVKDRVLIDSEEIHFIEIPKFMKMNVKNPKKLDFWLWFLDNTKKEMVEMATEKDLAIRKAVEELERLTADPALQRIIDAEELARMDEEVYRKQAINEGKAIGLEEGRREGRREGIKKGREEGRKEGIEDSKREIAKRLLEMHFEIEKISEITELSIDEINEMMD